MASQINASNSGFGGIVSTGDSSGVLQLQAAGTTIATIQSTGLNLSSNGLVFSDSSIQTAAASPYVLKNRIINGDMRIDQRNAGASVTGTTVYAVDRFATRISGGGGGVLTVQRSTTVPTSQGFVNSLFLQATTADTSIGAAEAYWVQQRIEGFNTADFGFGAANASTVTLSFWVRSSVTGTYSTVLQNSAGNRSYVSEYTISAANTWEYKTITITGDTSGTWLTDNGVGVSVFFCLAVGSTYQQAANSWGTVSFATGSPNQVNFMNTLNSTFYITGVQLEIGTSATPFERRLYNQELANCQRYYFKLLNTASGNLYVSSICGAYDTTRAFGALSLPVSMRATPTASYSSARVGSPNLSTVDQAVTAFFNQISAGTNQNQLFYEVNVASGLAANTFYFVKLPVSAYLDASAEL